MVESGGMLASRWNSNGTRCWGILSQGANSSTRLNGTSASSLPESNDSCAARAVSPNDNGSTGTVMGTKPVNQPIVVKSVGALRGSRATSP